MRDEMLERLDAFVEDWGDFRWSERGAAEWQTLRSELAAERCENCRHYVALCGDNRPNCGLNEIWGNAPDFCCSDFTKKEPTP